MKIYEEYDGHDFTFWSGAKDRVWYLNDDEIDTIFSILEEENPDGMSATEVNDFFWFEEDTIADWLGWPDFETLEDARSGDNWFDSYKEYEEAQEEEEED